MLMPWTFTWHIHADVLQARSSTDPPLVAALSQRNWKETRHLLEGRVDVNAGDQFGHSPLMFAALFGQPDLVRILLDRGADPNRRNVDGLSPLMIATAHTLSSKRGMMLDDSRDPTFLPPPTTTRLAELLGVPENPYTACLRELIAHGSDVNAVAPNGETALTYAIRRVHVQNVRILLSSKANVNAAIARTGATPLHLAARPHYNTGAVDDLPSGYDAVTGQIAELLLSYGADANARADAQRTPLMYAATARDAAVTRVLVNSHKVRTQSHFAPRVTNLDAIDTDGNTALMIAAANLADDVVAELLSGTPVTLNMSTRNRKGLDAYMMAVESKASPALLRTLGDGNRRAYFRLPRNGRFADGDTVLHKVVRPRILDATDIERLVTVLDADLTQLNARDSIDYTALMLAVRSPTGLNVWQDASPRQVITCYLLAAGADPDLKGGNIVPRDVIKRAFYAFVQNPTQYELTTNTSYNALLDFAVFGFKPEKCQ
jgi:ankyrin repeat protein